MEPSYSVHEVKELIASGNEIQLESLLSIVLQESQRYKEKDLKSILFFITQRLHSLKEIRVRWTTYHTLN